MDQAIIPRNVNSYAELGSSSQLFADKVTVQNKIRGLLLKTHCSVVLKRASMCFKNERYSLFAGQGAVLKEVHKPRSDFSLSHESRDSF